MAHATLFLYAGVLEGGRATLLEAMRCGAAIVAQETPLSRELAGDGVAWSETGSARSMARTIRRITSNPTHAGILRKKAAARAAGYSWETTATSLVKLFERTSADYRRPELPRRGETGPAQRLPTEGAEPNLDLVQSQATSRCVVKAHSRAPL